MVVPPEPVELSVAEVAKIGFSPDEVKDSGAVASCAVIDPFMGPVVATPSRGAPEKLVTHGHVDATETPAAPALPSPLPAAPLPAPVKPTDPGTWGTGVVALPAPVVVAAAVVATPDSAVAIQSVPEAVDAWELVAADEAASVEAAPEEESTGKGLGSDGDRVVAPAGPPVAGTLAGAVPTSAVVTALIVDGWTCCAAATAAGDNPVKVDASPRASPAASDPRVTKGAATAAT